MTTRLSEIQRENNVEGDLFRWMRSLHRCYPPIHLSYFDPWLRLRAQPAFDSERDQCFFLLPRTPEPDFFLHLPRDDCKRYDTDFDMIALPSRGIHHQRPVTSPRLVVLLFIDRRVCIVISSGSAMARGWS